MSNVQYVVIGVFILFAIIGVVVFAGFGGFGGETVDDVYDVTVWGVLPESAMLGAVSAINAEGQGVINLTYRELDENSFDSAFVNALAENAGPDLVIIPNTMLLRQEKRLSLIPWNYISERDYNDSFIDAGDIFKTSAGFYAFPLVVDPLVMYWNRDMFANKNISTPPRAWEEIGALAERLTKKTDSKAITESAIAFGEYQNVTNAPEILATLGMQAGSKMIARGEGGALSNLIPESISSVEDPFESALSFYSQFADPLKPIYSWNRSLPDSQTMFSRNALAMYFGFASEIQTIKSKNPNLNFDVSLIPQANVLNRNLTYGNVYGIGVVANSKNLNEAFAAAYLLSSPSSVSSIAASLSLPPARRDLLKNFPGSSAGDVFYSSALVSKAWLVPDKRAVSLAFKNMIESVATGRLEVSSAVATFSAQIDEMLR